MTILAGIDEAGLGPVLGPLVVSATVFDVPEPLAGKSLWASLSTAVCRTVRKSSTRPSGKLVIADSKKVYSRQEGLSKLERGVLATLSLLSQEGQSLRGLSGWLSPAVLGEIDEYPWYLQTDLPLPVECQPTELRLAANGLRAAMARTGISLRGAGSEVLLPGRYNRLIAATDNKATTALDQTCKLIDWVWRQHRNGAPVRIYVDRQGGREHYLEAMQRIFDGGRIKILVEEPEHSGYAIAIGGDDVEVHFMEGGEDRHLPVALASMVSKYVRELFMLLMNRYWEKHVPGLKHTAGYYEDGWRFLNDIQHVCEMLQTPRELLIRCR